MYLVRITHSKVFAIHGKDTEPLKSGDHPLNKSYISCGSLPLVRGDLVLPADKLISNVLAQIGDLKFKKIK